MWANSDAGEWGEVWEVDGSASEWGQTLIAEPGRYFSSAIEQCVWDHEEEVAAAADSTASSAASIRESCLIS